MKKTAITSDDVMRQLNTKVKTSLDGLKVALKDPTQNSAANITHMVDVAYREIISIIALLPKTTAVMTPVVPAVPAATPAKADDAETKTEAKTKIPMFWRKNLDYGER